jgi:hypothetical protein
MKFERKTAMYNIFKFSDSWFIYDSNKDNSRLLQKNEVELLESLFPTLFHKDNGLLTAIEIIPIQPNKLVKKVSTKKDKVLKKSETPHKSVTTN